MFTTKMQISRLSSGVRTRNISDKEAENNTWQLHFVPQSKQDNAPSTDLKSTSDTSAISNLHFGGNEKETRKPTT